MTTWGVAFGPNRLGSDATSGARQGHVFVNGNRATPERPLLDGDNVVSDTLVGELAVETGTGRQVFRYNIIDTAGNAG